MIPEQIPEHIITVFSVICVWKELLSVAVIKAKVNTKSKIRNFHLNCYADNIIFNDNDL